MHAFRINLGICLGICFVWNTRFFPINCFTTKLYCFLKRSGNFRKNESQNPEQVFFTLKTLKKSLKFS